MRGVDKKRFGLGVGVLGAAGMLAAVLPTAVPAVAGQEQPEPARPDSRAACTPQQLPVPADINPAAHVSVMDTDPSGRYVLGAEAGDGGAGLLWVDGELEAKLVGPPNSAGMNDLRAVNSAGVVLGESYGADWYVWTYQDGEYTTLPGKYNARDINENGDVLGTRYAESTIVWPADAPGDGVTLPGGQDVGADISDEGVVIGPDDPYIEGYDGKAYYWTDWESEPQILEHPAGVREALATGIAGDWVIGYANNDTDTGIRWNLAEGTVEKLPYYPSAVNSAGDIGTGGTIHRADGTALELPSPSDGADAVANTVSEPGSTNVAAGTYDPAGNDTGRRPVTWTC